MADAQGLGQLVEGDDGRVTFPALEAAEVLLAEARAGLDLLLGETLFAADACEVPTDEGAHVHGGQDRASHTLMLSTMVCIDRPAPSDGAPYAGTDGRPL